MNSAYEGMLSRPTKGDHVMSSQHTSTRPMQKDFYLYPVVHIWAKDEVEATNMLLKAIGDIGELTEWLPNPPSPGEKRLQAASPELKRRLDEAITHLDNITAPDWIVEAKALLKELEVCP